jgi:pantetheine hydrolase
MPQQCIVRLLLQGANIIVFPEDGLFGTTFSRSNIYHYLEHIPDPDTVSVNPCDDYPDPAVQPIQVRLSCAARQYNMWTVVNLGDVQNCTKAEDEDCPSDGRYQFNTNIVFNSNGDLVSRYHKYNLFYEFQFDMPKEVQHSVFETPYGRMGSFICFDILFKEPAVDLVEEFGIKHALFPVAWRSIIPSMSGLGFHESWAVRYGVNLLSSQYHLPELRWIGSAVYRAALGADNFFNDYSVMSPGKLLVTRTPIDPVPPPEGLVEVPKVSVTQDNFTAWMESNLYTWLKLEKASGELYLHDQDTYCYLRYKMANFSESEDVYAFGIFEGQHFDYLNSYIQVCALIRCSGKDNPSCGVPTREAYTVFEEVHLAGRFSVDYILPALLVDDGDIQKSAWDFMLDKENNGGLITATNMSRPLLSAILYTRDYARDNNTGFERPPNYLKNREDIGEFASFREEDVDGGKIKMPAKADMDDLHKLASDGYGKPELMEGSGFGGAVVNGGGVDTNKTPHISAALIMFFVCTAFVLVGGAIYVYHKKRRSLP